MRRCEKLEMQTKEDDEGSWRGGALWWAGSDGAATDGARGDGKRRAARMRREGVEREWREV